MDLMSFVILLCINICKYYIYTIMLPYNIYIIIIIGIMLKIILYYNIKSM